MQNHPTSIEISSEDFKNIGYKLIDAIAEFIGSINERPVTPGESPKQVQQIIGNASLPGEGKSAEQLLSDATALIIDHSLLNGHPKFFGYITSSPAPIGALADLLASAVNPNVGAYILSPVATEIERQTIKWLAEFIGVSANYGGVLVSGGNMANFTGFLAGRTVKAPKHYKENGISNKDMLKIYCAKATHTWIDKAATLFGLGSNAIHWIDVDDDNKIKIDFLEKAIEYDKGNGYKPIMVIGNAGDVSTGTVDDLKSIAHICKAHELWFHVDGAYGIPAAVVPDLTSLFEGIEEADSIALDPHKWLYSPLEAGCTLVKDPNHLLQTYSSHPVYYNFGNSEDIPPHNFYEYGLQNSRGFRALKVWLALQQVGKNGYIKLINENIRLSKLMFELAEQHPQLEAVTQNLSIATFRFVPDKNNVDEAYVNKLNESLLNELQRGGKVFLSNALVKEKYCLRACIVNFRTTAKDIEEVIEIIVDEGRKLHSKLSSQHA